jgi:heterotetrameric sarcosine oxidase delta subunit
VRLPCPFCGERNVHEFVCRGEAPPTRPPTDAPDALSTFVDYVYLRDNLPGPMREHWYHAAGCRRWLVIERDTRTHAVLSSAFVDGGGA